YSVLSSQVDTENRKFAKGFSRSELPPEVTAEKWEDWRTFRKGNDRASLKVMELTNMTIAQLIIALRTTRETFRWSVSDDDQRLRGLSVDGTVFDPIGVVCFMRTGRVFNEMDWLRAGKDLGLSMDDCLDVIEASNNELEHRTGKGIEVDPYKAWLRRQLEFAVGLKRQ